LAPKPQNPKTPIFKVKIDNNTKMQSLFNNKLKKKTQLTLRKKDLTFLIKKNLSGLNRRATKNFINLSMKKKVRSNVASPRAFSPRINQNGRVFSPSSRNPTFFPVIDLKNNAKKLTRMPPRKRVSRVPLDHRTITVDSAALK
jgi:hypothetical protein